MANTKITSNVIADGAITESKLASGVGGVAGIVSSADATAITIDSSENVAIGTDSPSTATPLTVYYSGTSQFNIGGPQSGISNNVYYNGSAYVNRNTSAGGALLQMGTDGSFAFRRATSGSSPTLSYSMYVDASGNIGVGTASPFGTTSNRTVLSVNGTSSATMNIGTGGSQRAYLYTDGSSATISTVGSIPLKLGVNDSSKLVTIDTGGSLCVGMTSTGSALGVTEASANEWTAAFYNSSSTPYGPLIAFTGAAPNDSTKKFLQMSDTSTVRAVFYSNGGLHNYQSNNSNLSDSREKKNIVDADAAWDDVKAWNIKKFHYNEENDSDPKRLGVIAQDLETNNPELISNFQKQSAADEVLWTEEDELPEGVSVGDVKTPAVEEIMRKGVKEQQMYWVAIKALQEALTKIEQLESRIETLEG